MTRPPQEPLSDELFRQLADNARDIILVTEAEPLDEPGPRIVYVNEAFTRLTGYQADEVIGRSPRFLQRAGETSSSTLHEIRQMLDSRDDFHGTILNFGKDSTPYWLDIRIFPLHGSDGRVTHFAAIERDITERTLAELELRRAALEDPLTGLFNRRGLAQYIAREWSSHTDSSGAVAVFDVDRFKDVNDNFGHTIGDAALGAVAASVRDVMRDGDFAARIGGDEFVLVMPATDTPTALALADDARQRVKQFTAQVAQPVTVSVGLAVGAALADLEELILVGDQALYQAKADGGDAVVKG